MLHIVRLELVETRFGLRVSGVDGGIRLHALDCLDIILLLVWEHVSPARTRREVSIYVTSKRNSPFFAHKQVIAGVSARKDWI